MALLHPPVSRSNAALQYTMGLSGRLGSVMRMPSLVDPSACSPSCAVVLHDLRAAQGGAGGRGGWRR